MNNLVNLNKELANYNIAEEDDSLLPYLTFTVDKLLCALRIRNVIAIEPLGEVTEVAQHGSSYGSGIKGISHYKSEAMNIFDLRSIFGFKSQIQQLEEDIDIQSHINTHITLFEKIENILNNKYTESETKEILESNAICKFGVWSAHYQSSYTTVKSQLEKVVLLHNNIHKYKEELFNLIKSKSYSSAKEYLEQLKTKYLNDFIFQMHNLEKLLRESIQDLIIVVNINNKKVGFLVDTVDSVENISEIQDLPETTQVSKFIRRMGFRKKGSEIVLIVEQGAFL